MMCSVIGIKPGYSFMLLCASTQLSCGSTALPFCMRVTLRFQP